MNQRLWSLPLGVLIRQKYTGITQSQAVLVIEMNRRLWSLQLGGTKSCSEKMYSKVAPERVKYIGRTDCVTNGVAAVSVKTKLNTFC